MSDRANEHAEQHLREAREVTTWGSQHQIEIQLGHVCNNRCVFCVSGQLTEQRLARPIPAEPIIAALERARAEGVRKVTFLGGEPTVQRSFLPSLERAVELGYEEIVLFTNGVKTRKPAFIDRVVALGDFTWRFSIQGGNEEAHDRVVKRRGAFQRIVSGLTYLGELGQDVTANMCVNEESYRSLPDFPALIAQHGVRQLHIDLVRPADAGVRTDEYLRSIIPRNSDMAPYLASMLEGFDALDPDFDVNIGNYPYCLLPEWAHKIHHDGELTFTIAADGQSQLSDPWNKYEQKRSDKQHPPGCEGCVFKAQCNGLFNKYVDFFGAEEVRAITLDELRQTDTRQHFFVLLVDEVIAPLLAGEPPRGWRAEQVFRNTRDRRIEVRYRDARERRATLVFTPPPGVGSHVEAPSPIWTTDRFSGAVQVGEGVDGRDVAGLVGWAERTLDAGSDLTWDLRADLPRLVAGFMTPERLGRARRRLLRLVGRVENGGDFARWRHEATRPMSTGLGAVLTLTGPDGVGADLELEIQPGEDRPLVAVSYCLAPGTAPEQAREGLGAVMEALRSKRPVSPAAA